MEFVIDHRKKLSLNSLEQFLKDKDATLVISQESKQSIKKCREYLDQKIKNSKEPIYGINTGFGSLCNVIIPQNDIEQLQENLVKSHACGAGDEVPGHWPTYELSKSTIFGLWQKWCSIANCRNAL